MFNAAEWGRIAGLLHDFGKFSHDFQKRLKGLPVPVDHATAGAQYIQKAWANKASHILAYVIAGHHAGLTDFGGEQGDESCLAMRLHKKICSFQEAALDHLPNAAGKPLPAPIRLDGNVGLQLSMFTRMLFSCLVDADSLDTEAYAEGKKADLRSNEVNFEALYDQYQLYMETNFGRPDSPIRKARNELYRLCLEQAGLGRGLYTLTLPTGSGKTLLTLGFALKHALEHGLRRIVFVIPYTSIIEQNAEVYRKVLGDEVVLEHHSNVQRDRTEVEEANTEYNGNLKARLELAEENWDFPIIVTTNVQLFESLYANKRSRCRKLHNLSRSVIVVDEAQMMNGEYYKPSLAALEELVRNYGSTVVLSTATQPGAAELLKDAGIQQPLVVSELVKDIPGRLDVFERVRPRYLGSTEYGLIAEQIASERQALCIVNTRSAAREIYERLKEFSASDNEDTFHLSARMCPKHRLIQLKKIRKRLKDKLSCRLVSTQLIECGVDVDFPVVYRELAGLDSISQAAGRCNREGKRKYGYTYVFETDKTPTRGWFGLTAGIARSILEQFGERSLTRAAVDAYFQELYLYQKLQGSTDKHGILELLNERKPTLLELPFRTVAERFQLIQTPARSILIPWDLEAEKQIQALKHAVTINGVLRKLQPYIVQLYPQEFAAFRRAGLLDEVRPDVFVLNNLKHWYDDNIGVKPFTEEHHQNESLVF